MRRLILLSATFCLLSIALFAQCDNGQLTKEVIGEISNEHRHNNVFTYGMVSYQSHEDNFYYESSEDPAFYLGYGKGLWVSSKDASDNLRLAANTYPTLNKHDFIPGPLSRTTGQPIDTLCGVFNRVWLIKGIDLFLLQAQFQNGELSLEDIPKDILEWPAKGNPYLEEFSPDYDLAPFFDLSEDGIYDPLSGDYPIAIEESPSFLPHEFSYVVYNDRGLHSETGGASTGIEFQQINYVVNCSEAVEAEHSVFTRIKYTYLGQESLSELKIALFEDNDLACNENDYTGCDLELNCSYFYNKGGETWEEECHDPDVPDNNGAVRTTVFFNQTMKSFKHWYLLGVGDTLIPGIDPTGAEEYYNYINGLWRDGQSMYGAGNGYDDMGGPTTLFAFSDRPNNPSGWSMETAGINVPADVRALTTLIDTVNVQPGHIGVIDFADHFLYDKGKKNLTVFEDWPVVIDNLKQDFAAMLNGAFNCGSGLEICIDDCVWPGDVDRDSAVTGKDIVMAGVFAGKNLSDGIPRGITSSDWFAFNAEDWSSSLLGVNAKNGDVNGNGTINENDLEALVDNFGRTRAGHIPQKILNETDDPMGLRVTFEDDTVNLETAVLFDRILNTDIALGNLDEQISEPIYGMSFDMQFDTNIVRPFVKIDEIFSEVFQFGYGGLVNAFRDGNELKGDNKIQYGFTNLDGNNSMRGGSVANQNLFIKDDAATINPDGVDTLVVRFYNVCAITVDGDPVEVGVVNDTVIITGLIVDPNLISAVKEVEDKQMSLFPNPARNTLTVEFERIEAGELTIYDLQGRALLSQSTDGMTKVVFGLENLQNGVFFMRLRKDNGAVFVEQFIKN